MDHVGPSTKEELCFGMSRIKSGSVRVNLVHEQIIVEAEYVEGRVRCMPALEEITVGRRWHKPHLCGVRERPLNDVCRHPGKEAFEVMEIPLTLMSLSGTRRCNHVGGGRRGTSDRGKSEANAPGDAFPLAIKGIV